MWTKWIEIITVKEPDKEPYSYKITCSGLRPPFLVPKDSVPSKLCPKGTKIETELILLEKKGKT